MRQLIILLFAFFLYSGTFNHSYVLDDNDIISKNNLTQKGIKGIPKIFASAYRADLNHTGDDLYRPLSKALFAFEWDIWPRSASAAHVINVLLYALLCLMLYTVLFRLFKEPLLPFIATLLFVCHPIHTEVVANIKSADEILALLFSLISLNTIIKYSESGKKYLLLLSALSFFTALLAKESAIVFIAIIPLTIYYFTAQSPKKNMMITAVHLIPLTAFLIIRSNVIADFESHFSVAGNYLGGIPGFMDQKATAVMLLGYYLLILVFPYRLMTDGSFSEFPSITMADWRFILPFIVLTSLIILAFLRFRQKKIESYSIFFFFIAVAIVSNIFILIGTNYGERLLFTPSLGICVLLAIVIKHFVKPEQPTKPTKVSRPFFQTYKKPIVASLILIVPYSVKTISRAADWKNELTLYIKDAESAPNSARAQYYLGNQYAFDLPSVTDESLRTKYAYDGIASLNRAIQISPKYDEAFFSLGQIYMAMGNLDSAAKYYIKAAETDPMNARFQNNYGDAMFKKGNFELAKEKFELAVKLDPLYRDALVNLGTSYGRLGQGWLEDAKKAQEVKNEEGVKKNLSVSMAYYDSAIVVLNKSIDLDRGFYLPYFLLGIVYQNKEDQETANYYFAKANELKANRSY